MKIIKGERGSGKTTKLIEQSYIYGYKIVVATDMQKQSIQKKAEDMGLKIPSPITYDEIIANNEDYWGEDVLIDELQYFLTYTLRASVKLVTTSDEIIDLNKIMIL